MAIKTKKISELADIEFDKGLEIVDFQTMTDLDGEDFYLLGCKGGNTGKVATKGIMNTLRKVMQTISVSEESSVETVASEEIPTVDISKFEQEVSQLGVSVSNCSSKIQDIETKQKTYAFSTAQKIDELTESIAVLTEKGSSTNTASCDCAEKIAALEAKVAALEGFVQALQAEGYLTLANIKKAAADACPICTHTHEESAE